MNEKVSVLLPVYNASKTVRAAIESIQNQTFTNFEVIVVDDGSVDDTPSILMELAQADARIHIISCNHHGIVDALNKGLSFCHAPLVARMDADDFAEPERLALQVAFLEAHPDIDVVGSRVRGFPEEEVREGFQIYLKWLNSLITDEEIRREIFIESPLPHPSVMFRKEVILAVGGYQDHGWAEDYDLWLRLYIAGKKFGKRKEVLLAWREHSDRLTRRDPRYSLENFLRAKAFYLALGPLSDRDAVFIWGAGMIGRRLSKHLVRNGVPLKMFVDVDQGKIGKTLRGFPIDSYLEIPTIWNRYQNPVLLAAVGAREARQKIRNHLVALGLQEGIDWWGVA